MTSGESVDLVLRRAAEGDSGSVQEMTTIVYAELRRLASHYLAGEREGHTLQPTALVHEAFLRLVGYREAHWNDRAHFMALAAAEMRRVLVDHARRLRAVKRGRLPDKVPLDDAAQVLSPVDVDLETLDDALRGLEKLDPRGARIVELRYFGGLTINETAEALGVSAMTVKREWETSRRWLFREMNRR